MKIKIWALMTILLANTGYARYVEVKHEAQFLEEINKFEYSLVCFLYNPCLKKGYENKAMHKDIKNLQDTIHAASQTEPYKHELKNDVGFIVVDARKDSIQSLVQKYAISCNQSPQFLLFYNGKVVTQFAEIAKLVGYVSKADLLDFIQDYFGPGLDTILEQKADEKQADKEMQLARYAAYATARYPYGCYAPYNAYGPYSWYGYNTFYQNHGYWGHTFYVP